tara:strand:- start:2102 stop:2278 length:177 start_codon:yes stop_codon:yes gene_type:complete
MASWNWWSYGLGAASVPVAYLAFVWARYGVRKLVALIKPKVEGVVSDVVNPENLDKKK